VGIDTYLVAIQKALGPRRGARFLAEIHDHLLEAVADGLERGLARPAAEAQAIERFGPPGMVARLYTAELAAATWEKHMHTLRLIAAAFALLTLYYARFFVAVRQEAATLVQIGILLVAATVLALPARLVPDGAAWFRSWRPITVQGWLTTIVAVGLAVTFFVWADHDSHSASDTLNRAVPTLCLIAAIALRIAYQFDHSRMAARLD
jgi:hypothetical protein